MLLVEVLKGRRQLREHRSCVTQVHAGHVVALEGVHEAVGCVSSRVVADRPQPAEAVWKRAMSM